MDRGPTVVSLRFGHYTRKWTLKSGTTQIEEAVGTRISHWLPEEALNAMNGA